MKALIGKKDQGYEIIFLDTSGKQAMYVYVDDLETVGNLFLSQIPIYEDDELDSDAGRAMYGGNIYAIRDVLTHEEVQALMSVTKE